MLSLQKALSACGAQADGTSALRGKWVDLVRQVERNKERLLDTLLTLPLK